MRSRIILLAACMLAISGLAHARSAVYYTCAGYEPQKTLNNGPISKQAVVFQMISAETETTIDIVSKTNEAVSPENAHLTIDSTDCTFSMLPDERYPAYRVSVSGTCGTKVDQNIIGICFFD